MKLIIDIDEELARKIENLSPYLCDELLKRIANGIPLEEDLPTFKEEFHCTVCVHYVHRDVPSIFCENCQCKEEMLRRINNER